VLNLGVEGMMLVGAMTAYKVSGVHFQSRLGCWLQCLRQALSVRSMLSFYYPSGDQVVSGLALNFLATG